MNKVVGVFWNVFIGISYVIHSFGVPVSVAVVKPYQLIAIIVSPVVFKKKISFIVLLLFLLHGAWIFLSGDGEFDLKPYIFSMLIVIYSLLFIKQLEVEGRYVLLGVTFMYAIGILSYLYALYTASYLNIHKDVQARSDLVNSIFSFVFFDGSRVRYNGFALDPNFFAFYVNILLGIVLIYVKKNLIKLPKIFIYLSVLSVLLTLSRAGILSMILLYFGWKWSGRNLSLKIVIVVFIPILLVIMAYVTSLMGRSILNFSDFSGSRLWVWSIHFENILRNTNYFFGQGLSFDVVRFIDEELIRKSTHNTLLYLIYCYGFIFIFIFLYLWVSRLIKILLNSPSNEKSLHIGLHFVFIIGLFSLDLIFTVPFYLYAFFTYYHKSHDGLERKVG